MPIGEFLGYYTGALVVPALLITFLIWLIVKMWRSILGKPKTKSDLNPESK